MPIRFKCACGKALVARDEQAGKRTKCPACQQPIVIPAPPAPAPASDELRLALAEEPEKHYCPNCNAELAPDAVVCARCGYDLQTGEVPGKKAKKAPLAAFPLGKAIAAAVVLAALAAGWFFVVAPMFSGAKLNSAYAYFVEGQLDRALREFEALRSGASARDRETLDLWISQVKLEQTTNTGETLSQGREVNSKDLDFSVDRHGQSGGALLYKIMVRNLGQAPLRVRLGYFYVRGIGPLKPPADDHADNTLVDVTVGPGQSRDGVLAFRGVPAQPVIRATTGPPVTYYYISFNDGVRYVKRFFPF